MRTYNYLLCLVFSLVTLLSCQQEISFENLNNTSGTDNNSSPGWSFKGAGNAAYKGCIDTAYYEGLSGIKMLNIEATDANNNELSITLVSQTGNFSAGTYTTAQGAIMTLNLNSGASYASVEPTSFSINITTINDTVIVATFHATLSDVFGGSTYSITDGKIKALIGKKNICSSTTGGGGPVAGSSIFSVNDAAGHCSATVEGVYIKDSALTAANKVKLEVTVITPGSWSLSTATIHGFKFSGSGSFPAIGTHTITLQASGTPVAHGNTDFPVSSNNSNCSFSVPVDTVAVAPCNPANNTATFSLGGIGPFNFYASNKTVTCCSYEIEGHSTAGDLKFEFATPAKPAPGVYNVVSQSGNFYAGDVRVSMVGASIYWQSNTGKVYVTHNNNKVVATFCNVSFSGSLGGPSYTTLASAKLTEQ